MKLPPSFYQRSDVVAISRNLLGKYLFTNIAGELTPLLRPIMHKQQLVSQYNI